MRSGKLFDDLVTAMGGNVKRAIVKKFTAALEKALLDHLRDCGQAKLPRIVSLKKTMKTARPEQERKLFGKLTKIPARPETIVYKAFLAKTLRDQL